MRLAFLGPVEAWEGDVRVPLGPPQQRCVLAALALEPNRVLPVERLMDIVWSGEPPPSARNALQVAVSRLRRIFAGTSVAVVTRAPGYMLVADPEDIDVHRFVRLVTAARLATDDRTRVELLREALALWRGQAMDDLELDARERLGTGLDGARWSAVEDRIEAELRLGRAGGDLLDELHELVRRQPLREALAGHYMTALHLAGRRAEALAHYGQLAATLDAELGLAPGAPLEKIRTRVLRGERPPDQRRVPRQLPPAPRGFTGRDSELAALDAARRSSDAVALVGTAGVGKTALAVHWAHLRADDYPDGQLYLDLQGYGGRRRLDPAQALERLLRLLGVAGGDLPAAVEERTALFRSTIAARAMLVVLDNARSSAEVRPLLPASAGSFSIITSRNRLDGLVARDGVPAVTVPRLPEDDAFRLFDSVAVDDPVAARRLAALCDNLPLALRIAAARLSGGGGAGVGVEGLITELSDTRRRLDALSVEDGDSAIRSVLLSSYHAVPAGAARLLRLLSLHPGEDTNADAAAALLDVPPADARRLLELLADEHLVERRGGDRYGMHDLIRLLAGGLADREETAAGRRTALRGLLLWYVHSAFAAEQVLNPLLVRLAPDAQSRPPHARSFASTDAALAWLDDERVNLFAAVRQAYAGDLPEEGWLLANGLYTYLRRGYYLAEYIEFYEGGTAAAALADELAAEAVLSGGLGIAYSFARRVDEALAAYTRAEMLFGTLGDPEQQARVRCNMGCIRMEAGDFEQAGADLRRAADLARAADSLTVEGACLSSLALLQIWRGHPDDAEEYLAEALVVAGKLDHPYWEPNVHEYYGDMHRDRGQYEEAIGHYEEALRAARAIGERVIEARVLAVLAEALVKGGHRAPGRRRMVEALDLAGAISGPLAGDIERRLAHLDGDSS